MTKAERQEKRLIELIKKMNNEETRVINLVLDAITAGGKAGERVAKGSVWLKSPEGEKLSHSDTLKVIEAIATGNIDILPGCLLDSVREVVFAWQEDGAA